MKREQILIAILLLPWLALCIDGSSDVRSVPLIGDLRSRMSAEAVAAHPEVAGSEFRKEYDRTIELTSGEEVKHEVYEIEPFMHLGSGGRLRLIFFEDQLGVVLFFPADPDAYLPRFEQEFGVSSASPSRELSPNLSVWESHRLHEDRFVGWADIELQERFDPYRD